MIYAGIDIAKSSHVIGATDERGRDAAKPMQQMQPAQQVQERPASRAPQGQAPQA